MSEISKISGRTVFESPWLHLREDLVRFPDGSTGQYGVVDKSDFALVIPKHADGGHLFEAYGFLNQGVHVFLAEDLSQGQMKRDAGETGMATGAFSMGEMKEMILSGGIKDVTTLAAIGLMSLFGGMA